MKKVLRTFKNVFGAHKACGEYMMSAGLYAWVLNSRSEGRWFPWGSSSVPHLIGFHLLMEDHRRQFSNELKIEV
jgi:hypothetical protein